MKNISIVLMVGLAAGCGGAEEPPPMESGCALEARADEYAQGLKKSGSTFTLTLTDATPAPPEVGNNDWSLELKENGMAVNTATITVKPWMPDHGHGTIPLFLEAKRLPAQNIYQLEKMDLYMPGYWTFTFKIKKESVRDEIIFQFCLDELDTSIGPLN